MEALKTKLLTRKFSGRCTGADFWSPVRTGGKFICTGGDFYAPVTRNGVIKPIFDLPPTNSNPVFLCLAAIGKVVRTHPSTLGLYMQTCLIS